MKPLRQTNNPVISYVPRVEPSAPEQAMRVDGFQDVYLLHARYVSFVLAGERFLRSPDFDSPESAQRWATQIRRQADISD